MTRSDLKLIEDLLKDQGIHVVFDVLQETAGGDVTDFKLKVRPTLETGSWSSLRELYHGGVG